MATKLPTLAQYRGFDLIEKRDMPKSGVLIRGQMVHEGVVVCYAAGAPYAGCNALPGATWAVDVAHAERLVDAYLAAGGSPTENTMSQPRHVGQAVAAKFWVMAHMSADMLRSHLAGIAFFANQAAADAECEPQTAGEKYRDACTASTDHAYPQTFMDAYLDAGGTCG